MEMPVAGTSSFPNLAINLSYLPPPATEPKITSLPLSFSIFAVSSTSKTSPV